MRIYIDLDLLLPVEAPGLNNFISLAAKLATDPFFEVQFVRDGSSYPLPTGSSMAFALKPMDSFGVPTDVYCDSFTSPTAVQAFTDGATTNGSNVLQSENGANFQPWMINSPISGAGIPGGTVIEEYVNSETVILSANATATAAGNLAVSMTIPDPTGYYTAYPSFNTGPLFQAFGRNADGSGESSTVELEFNPEFTWLTPGQTLPERTLPFGCTIYDNVIDTDEGVPDSGSPVYPSPNALVVINAFGWIPIGTHGALAPLANGFQAMALPVGADGSVLGNWVGGQSYIIGEDPVALVGPPVYPANSIVTQDEDGNIAVGPYGRLSPLANGLKAQASADGVTWIDAGIFTTP